jgi:uncharacterized membrane protein
VDLFRDLVVAGAVVTTGLLAGLYYGYACSVMPALRGADDPTFDEVMQRINVAILNGWFMVSFLGSPALSVLAVGLDLGDGGSSVLPWLVVAAVLNLASFLVTAATNVPLNNALAAAGATGSFADPSSARSGFERPWVRSNVVRAVASTAGLAALVGGLLT